ncbi:MAG: type II toxin-antitoxin system Phd/YefM family antitoxin [Anaerolineae bacterium]
MIPRYSIAQARNRFAEIIRNLESHERVEVTRRGRPVAVLMAIEAFERLQAAQTDFWDSYQAFRARHDLDALAIGPETFAETRDRSAGRETVW